MGILRLLTKILHNHFLNDDKSHVL